MTFSSQDECLLEETEETISPCPCMHFLKNDGIFFLHIVEGKCGEQCGVEKRFASRYSSCECVGVRTTCSLVRWVPMTAARFRFRRSTTLEVHFA